MARKTGDRRALVVIIVCCIAAAVLFASHARILSDWATHFAAFLKSRVLVR